LPEWSPDGQWIKFLDHEGGKGWTLISPDGKTERALGVAHAIEMTFSKDSSRLYGIRQEQGRARLFSLDLATMKVKNIGELARDFVPRTGFLFNRLSLAPDGKSILYAYRKSDLQPGAGTQSQKPDISIRVSARSKWTGREESTARLATRKRSCLRQANRISSDTKVGIGRGLQLLGCARS